MSSHRRWRADSLPGRKTGVADATWLADLLAHGLIRASFVPDAQTQELRALLRLHLDQIAALAEAVELLPSIPEVGTLSAQVIVAEIGTDMGRFPSAANHDRGPDHFDHRSKEAQARRLVRRLADLGFTAEIKPVTA